MYCANFALYKAIFDLSDRSYLNKKISGLQYHFIEMVHEMRYQEDPSKNLDGLRSFFSEYKFETLETSLGCDSNCTELYD